VDAPALVRLARAAGLKVRASASWPQATGDPLRGLPGFIESSFSPLVAEVAERCLRVGYGAPPSRPELGRGTAVIIATEHGDLTSAARVSRAVATRGRISPLLFFQAVPNAVAGLVAARWGLAGPVVCVGSGSGAIDVARLLIADGDADTALVILAEQSRDDIGGDRAEAVLVDREVSP
jgi:hypothetical protein